MLATTAPYVPMLPNALEGDALAGTPLFTTTRVGPGRTRSGPGPDLGPQWRSRSEHKSDRISGPGPGLQILGWTCTGPDLGQCIEDAPYEPP
jgi:hypothetical protein